MAKVLTIWLLLIYAFSATGATVHLHYCCGKLQQLTLETEPGAGDDDCVHCVDHHETRDHPTCHQSDHCNADVQSHNHCQYIEVKAQKTTAEHLPGSDKNLLKIHSAELSVFSPVRISDFPADRHLTARPTPEPAVVGSIPLFIQHCTYRI